MTDFPDTGQVACQNGNAGGTGFEDRPRQPFPQRGEEEEVGCLEQPGDIRPFAGEYDFISNPQADAELAALRLDIVSTPADEEQSGMGVTGSDQGKNGDKFAVIFSRSHPADMDIEPRIERDVEFLPGSFPVSGSGKGGEVKAIVNDLASLICRPAWTPHARHDPLGNRKDFCRMAVQQIFHEAILQGPAQGLVLAVMGVAEMGQPDRNLFRGGKLEDKSGKEVDMGMDDRVFLLTEQTAKAMKKQRPEAEVVCGAAEFYDLVVELAGKAGKRAELKFTTFPIDVAHQFESPQLCSAPDHASEDMENFLRLLYTLDHESHHSLI